MQAQALHGADVQKVNRALLMSACAVAQRRRIRHAQYDLFSVLHPQDHLLCSAQPPARTCAHEEFDSKAMVVFEFLQTSRKTKDDKMSYAV